MVCESPAVPPGPEADEQVTVSLIDIDDSILQSERKCGEANCEPVGYDSQGRAVGFMRRSQRLLFLNLMRMGAVIPATARNRETLSRVRLPFNSWRICSYGGLIVDPQGQVDPHWHDLITRQAKTNADTLNGVHAELKRIAGETGCDIRSWITEDEGNQLYVVAKHNQHDATQLLDLANLVKPLAPKSWRLHVNDNNIAFLPDFLGKENAALYLLNEVLKPTLAIGLGDSFIDLPFMGLCHFALMPSGSQAFQHLLQGNGAH